MVYIIRSVSEGAAHDEPPLFWSNGDGWGDAATATRFTEAERQTFNLPLSAGHDAAWVKQGDGEEPTMMNETPPTAHNAEVAPGVRGHRYNVHVEDYDYMSSAHAYAVRGPAGIDGWHVYAKGTHALVGRAAWRAEAVQIILAF